MMQFPFLWGQKMSVKKYAHPPQQFPVRQSLVLFRDRMVTNCLLFACRASAGEELRRALYSTGWREKNQAPFLWNFTGNCAGTSNSPLTNPAEVANIKPYLNILR